MTLDAAWYTSPAAFATERERIFSQRWILVGREEQIDKPGDYFVADVNGESIIVTRDSQRAIHAFYNVCRHRGTRVCEASSGHFQGSIQCPYHAWTYGLDGTLKAARNMAEVSGFDRSQYPLHESAAAAWEGFIFVNLSDALRQAPREAQTAFDREFAPLIGRFAKWDIANLKTAR
ncbi:MAG: Rieske (2Fe-2S) protein, partial [Candidatus Eremiobacteraeota bacterium]|nr:Rieske (2Fe-2S) protein [Candidatus Eremiobacteraeota bacterium]